MENNYRRIIFHVDVNSAFLSWSAVEKLKKGEMLDIRQIPAVIGGNPKDRHGVVLAKSIPAKLYDIHTGEPIVSAQKKCPNLKIISPSFKIYMKYSNEMFDILNEYTPIIERYSIDECFLEFTNINNPVNLALNMKDKIKQKLGFTVNVGISTNKVLAKMASDFKKPDKVHTLFINEIQNKMWHLPVENLFMVGKATKIKLNKLNIYTIGDLAKCDSNLIKNHLKSHGNLIWNYANGIDDSKVIKNENIDMKGIGNSITLTSDINDRKMAYKIILALCENVCAKLRKSNNLCSVVCVTIKNSEFISYSKQKTINNAINSTVEIAHIAYEIFDTMWRGESIRLLGVSVSKFCNKQVMQISFFDNSKKTSSKNLDNIIDSIREKYGNKSIMRADFINPKKK